MNKRYIAGAIVPVAVAVTLSGCAKGSGSVNSSEASASAAAKALSTDPAVIKDKKQAAKLANKCLPVKANVLAQIKYVRIFIATPQSKKYGAKGVKERAKLSDCAGVPESQRPAFYDALKTSAITAAGAYAKGDHTAIKTWFLTTAPDTAISYQKKVMTPKGLAEHVIDMLVDRKVRGDAVSDVYMDGESAVFYVDIFQPSEGNQRFSVTVTECTDIKT